ncbi:MAG TPA: hypothetical protein VK209_01240 [Candidatus Sulfotelmatobacter sp.]|nr:hypothetical protein [Candidatus Sulfotelmatobacter sp.]
MQEEHEVTVKEVGEKTLSNLKRLGEQVFAVSPFSQYFDDWLINVKEVVSKFETSDTINTDELFVRQRQQTFDKLEIEFARLKQEELKLNQAVRELADNNHLLVETDADYATKTRELGPRKDAEIQRLTLDVQKYESELEQANRMKTSFFGFTKKAKAQKEAEARSKLEAAKTKLESAVQAFKVEQEKLHDTYEKKRSSITEHVQQLEKEVEKLETDNSVSIRREACEELSNAVQSLLDRQPLPSSEPTS